MQPHRTQSRAAGAQSHIGAPVLCISVVLLKHDACRGTFRLLRADTVVSTCTYPAAQGCTTVQQQGVPQKAAPAAMQRQAVTAMESQLPCMCYIEAAPCGM